MREAKTARQSQFVMSKLMEPHDAGTTGSIHGGAIMKLIDTAATMAAVKHARCRVVTAAIDSVSFLAPVNVGDLVTVRTSVNYVGNSSIEVGATVETENLFSGKTTHVASAYLVYVALGEDGKPQQVPELIAENETEKRRLAEAKIRADNRARARRLGDSLRSLSTRSVLRNLRAPGHPPLVIGHRGAMGHAPENTMASFKKAVELHADIVEMDVQMSADGELMVIHDPRVDRTTNSSGFVGDMTAEQIRSLDAGSWLGAEYVGEKVPLLDEVLEWARDITRIAIEIKNAPIRYEGIEEKVVQAIHRHQVEQSALVISFDHAAVKRIKALCPNVATGILYAASPIDPVALALAADADILLPQWTFASSNLVAKAHEVGLAVCVWVANEREEIAFAAGLDVDGIASNYPDRVRSILGR